MMRFLCETKPIIQKTSDKTIQNNVRKPIKINLHHFYTKFIFFLSFQCFLAFYLFSFLFYVETLLFLLYSTLMMYYYPDPDGIICTYQVHYFHASLFTPTTAPPLFRKIVSFYLSSPFSPFSIQFVIQFFFISL